MIAASTICCSDYCMLASVTKDTNARAGRPCEFVPGLFHIFEHFAHRLAHLWIALFNQFIRVWPGVTGCRVTRSCSTRSNLWRGILTSENHPKPWSSNHLEGFSRHPVVRIQSRKWLEHCAVPRGMPLGFVCLAEALKSHAAVAEEWLSWGNIGNINWLSLHSCLPTYPRYYDLRVENHATCCFDAMVASGMVLPVPTTSPSSHGSHLGGCMIWLYQNEGMIGMWNVVKVITQNIKQHQIVFQNNSSCCNFPTSAWDRMLLESQHD